MLNWAIAELMKYKETPLHFTETVDVKADLIKRDPEIMDVSSINVDGYISFDKGDYLVSVTLAGSITVPSTRSLKPVELPMNFTFSEIYLSDPDHADQYEDGELLIELTGDRLDLVSAVEDHLLLNIPMQVLTPEEAADDEMPSGTDWEVMTESDYQATQEEQAEQPNAAFAKLKDLFNDDDAPEDDK